MHPTKSPPIDLNPVIHKLIAFPSDPLNSTELADILGVHRASINDALRDGVIGNTASCLRNHGKAKNARRLVTKAEVIKWLWNSHVGDRSLLEQALREKAPRVLAHLLSQAGPAGGPQVLPPNVTPFPRPSAKAVQTELSLFSA